jgi:hypothetical protein
MLGLTPCGPCPRLVRRGGSEAKGERKPCLESAQPLLCSARTCTFQLQCQSPLGAERAAGSVGAGTAPAPAPAPAPPGAARPRSGAGRSAPATGEKGRGLLALAPLAARVEGTRSFSLPPLLVGCVLFRASSGNQEPRMGSHSFPRVRL